MWRSDQGALGSGSGEAEGENALHCALNSSNPQSRFHLPSQLQQGKLTVSEENDESSVLSSEIALQLQCQFSYHHDENCVHLQIEALKAVEV